MLKITLLIVLVVSQIIYGQSLHKSLYVVNTLGENLSFINLENQTVNSNAATLGLYTNEIKIRGSKGYIINSGLNEIQVINLQSFSTLTRISTGTGTNPYNMDFVNDSLAVVSLLFTNKVAIINVNSGSVVQNINVGYGPEGVKYYNGKIYVTNTNFNGVGYDPGSISVIDAASLTVINTIDVGVNPQSIDVDTNGNLIVACTGDYASVLSQVDVIDLSADTVLNSIPVSTFINSVFINSNNKIYITTYGYGVMVYNLVTQAFERDTNNPLPGGPGCAFDNQNNCYITHFNSDSILVFSENHTRLNSYLVGDGPMSVDIIDQTANLVNTEEIVYPEKMILCQNYPNPFNPETQIRFYLPGKGDVRLTIFNMLGQEIYSITKSNVSVGYNTITFNGSNFASGIYFYQLKAGNFTEMKRMVSLR